MATSQQQDVLGIKPGDLIDGMYLVLSKLGEGGNGAVYRCKNDKIGPDAPPLAIKMLYESASDRAIQRFARERDLMRGAEHPNVIKCMDYGKHGDHPYLVLEFVDGGSVHDYLGKQNRLTEREAAWIAWQTIAGLRSVGTVHRDLKPENLLLMRGKGQRKTEFIVGDIENGALLKVADWGLAMSRTETPQRLTLSTEVFGTPYYISPEQARKSKEVTVLADMYSLGCVLYELLVGRPPFEGEILPVLQAHCNELHVYPDGFVISPPMRAIIDRCMQKEVRHRYASFRELQEALRPILELPKEWVYYGGKGDQEAVAPSGMFSALGKYARNIGGLFK